ncbi:HD domain-containing protein [Thalassorhabdomicrobium marinisediminis]|uniref:HD domain-containing protein n=1 Tax=Thalassorhabdomicrobium marinisediminis TaxID=2170577 RepID=UPI002493085F|nr:HD domain-containing protein [Thalassorhabdomicrobium marinisediminis]
MPTRLERQLDFLVAADRLKSVQRPTTLADGSRPENAAEHAWHLCLWALVFADQSNGANLGRVIQMLLLHALPTLTTRPTGNSEADALAESAAIQALFSRLPADQAVAYGSLWQEYHAGRTTDARFARTLVAALPVFLDLSSTSLRGEEFDALRAELDTGAFAALHDDWPDLYHYADALLSRRTPIAMEPLAARLRFVMEADRLKSVIRGTTLCDGSRRENSAEHSWHIMLWAWTLEEHSAAPVRLDLVLQMLLLHDLVEIDAGDNPIHGNFDAAAVEAQEQAAAARLFGMLPAHQRIALRAIWETFEASQTPDAVFAKAVDRAQPLICNLETDGGSWHDYPVRRAQLQTRVGDKVKRGAPALWSALAPRIDAWFAAHRPDPEADASA